jgi:hypothetical protein
MFHCWMCLENLCYKKGWTTRHEHIILDYKKLKKSTVLLLVLLQRVAE